MTSILLIKGGHIFCSACTFAEKPLSILESIWHVKKYISKGAFGSQEICRTFKGTVVHRKFCLGGVRFTESMKNTSNETRPSHIDFA